MIGVEVLLPNGLSIHLEHDDHECAHQVAAVRLLVELVRTIVVDALVQKLRVLYILNLKLLPREA